VHVVGLRRILCQNRKVHTNKQHIGFSALVYFGMASMITHPLQQMAVKKDQ